ncbi:hypothetical protein ACFW1A_34025 [Kitasatospora sp. NPDC058965]|uniref:hypothetical protein n=1 Tax=Kitasatospora sp. NPDC058965 TaxID=3346682 RepID=UPI0036A0BF19
MACPTCGGENTATARQVYERAVALPAGWDPALLAPPPAPVDPATLELPAARPPMNGRTRAMLIIGALLVAYWVFDEAAGLGSTDVGDQTYQAGWALGHLIKLLAGIGLLIGGVAGYRNRRWAVGDPADLQHLHLHNRAVYTRRAQVWEHAQVCLDCPGAFFAAGVLRPDFPASPLIGLGQFPVMVATMADRAFAGAA